VAISF